MATSPPLSPNELTRICRETTRRFGLNKCHDCAKALTKTLKASGFHGELVQLKTEGATRGFIVMKNPKFPIPFPTGGTDAISETGQHFGVRVSGKVYCNVFQDGVNALAWD